VAVHSALTTFACTGCEKKVPLSEETAEFVAHGEADRRPQRRICSMDRELVLNFHGLGTPHKRVGGAELPFWMPREKFATLLDHLAALTNSAGLRTAITFDDGNLSDATDAMPELARRGLTARFFVCAGRIGAPHYLDRSAISEMLAAGMEVGTHGMLHRDWRGLDDNELNSEIGLARRFLEDVCGRPVGFASIPFGSYDRRVLARLRQEALDCVYTSDRGLACAGTWLKPRETVESSWAAQDIERLMVKRPSPTARLRRRAAMVLKAWR
jgi:peptidoglycan/xylan/chitin deacetylase (PgdA/CDA1 family)